jgi:hypothetical protein
MSTKEKVDLFLNKWVSRKLTVFVIASAGLFFAKLDGDNWTIVATVYISIEGATNIVERLMKLKNDNKGIIG